MGGHSPPPHTKRRRSVPPLGAPAAARPHAARSGADDVSIASCSRCASRCVSPGCRPWPAARKCGRRVQCGQLTPAPALLLASPLAPMPTHELINGSRTGAEASGRWPGEPCAHRRPTGGPPAACAAAPAQRASAQRAADAAGGSGAAPNGIFPVTYPLGSVSVRHTCAAAPGSCRHGRAACREEGRRPHGRIAAPRGAQMVHYDMKTQLGVRGTSRDRSPRRTTARRERRRRRAARKCAQTDSQGASGRRVRLIVTLTRCDH